MRYLNKIIFLNSAHIPYAEVKLDGNVLFIGTQGWARVPCSVRCCSSIMLISCVWASRRRRNRLMPFIFLVPIHTSSMR